MKNAAGSRMRFFFVQGRAQSRNPRRGAIVGPRKQRRQRLVVFIDRHQRMPEARTRDRSWLRVCRFQKRVDALRRALKQRVGVGFHAAVKSRGLRVLDLRGRTDFIALRIEQNRARRTGADIEG